MADLHTERLILHPITTDEAERMIARQPGPQDAWADDFPFDGDLIAATMFLRATIALGDQQPFGHYVIIRTADGLAVGGTGFKSQPSNGTVEIGYGLAPSARGKGFAAEAARALVELAGEQGILRVVADTDMGNTASQQTLENAGFTNTGINGDLLLYERIT
ncbi:MAG: GNAT family N-acetyltransferase [Actinomycetota bacterium]|nr:GNAT family N-acetyltransferase [Actinomycetota bacterium]